eukprot:1187022-Rhodomonas_salina.1
MAVVLHVEALHCSCQIPVQHVERKSVRVLLRLENLLQAQPRTFVSSKRPQPTRAEHWGCVSPGELR